MGERVNIMWDQEMDRLVEKIVAKHAGKMGEMGIAPKTKVRPGGEAGPNRSGAILYALRLAAGEVERNRDGSDQ